MGNGRFVFNIKGNDYRLVAIVIFASKKVYVRYIGAHEEYYKIDCSTILAADYEEANYPVAAPELVDVIKLRLCRLQET